MEFQEYWEAFLIGPFLFFAGLVGMSMVFLSIYKMRRRELNYEALMYILLVSITLALLLVMADLTRPPTVMMISMLNSFLELRYNLFLPALRGEYVLRFSWMALGIVMLIIALLLVAIWTLHYLIPRLRTLYVKLPRGPLPAGSAARLEKTINSIYAKTINALNPLLNLLEKLVNYFLSTRWFYILAIVVGILVTLYSGFLISEAKGVPFWNVSIYGIPAIPLIWIFSASAGALALIRMYHLRDHHVVSETEKYGALAETGEIIAIFAYLGQALGSTSIAAVASAQAVMWGVLAPWFWIGVIGVGIALPLAITAVGYFRHSPALTYVACVAGLIGALILRTLVVYAGIPEPLG